MRASTQIARWGNSLGLRVPKALASEAGLVEGDTVEISVQDGSLVLRPTKPSYSLVVFVAKITPENRHDESDWGQPVGREQW